MNTQTALHRHGSCAVKTHIPVFQASNQNLRGVVNTKGLAVAVLNLSLTSLLLEDQQLGKESCLEILALHTTPGF